MEQEIKNGTKCQFCTMKKATTIFYGFEVCGDCHNNLTTEEKKRMKILYKEQIDHKKDMVKLKEKAEKDKKDMFV